MANYNLNQAISMFNEDQVRTQHMYEVDFHSGVEDIDSRLLRMQVYGQSFSLPERTVDFESVQYRAYEIPVPTRMTMGQDHSVTVYADVRGDLRAALLDWQALCVNPAIGFDSYFESNRRPTRIGQGTDNEPYIDVKLLAPDFKTPLEITHIVGVRVTKVGSLELSNTGASISTFSVDFKSVYWEQYPVGSAGARNNDGTRSFALGNPAEAWSGQATMDNVSLADEPKNDWTNAGSGQGGMVPA